MWKENIAIFNFQKGSDIIIVKRKAHTITAFKLNRKAIGFEINKDYVEMANKRIQGWSEQRRLDKFIKIR